MVSGMEATEEDQRAAVRPSSLKDGYRTMLRNCVHEEDVPPALLKTGRRVTCSTNSGQVFCSTTHSSGGRYQQGANWRHPRTRQDIKAAEKNPGSTLPS